MTASETEQIEAWFDAHGLPYFTGDHAEDVEEWLSSWRITGVLVLIVAGAGGVGTLVWLQLDDASSGALAGMALFVVVLAAFAGSFLRMGTMVRWALRRTFGSLGLLFPLLTRALPLLLLAVTFLFINAEVWQVAALLPRPVLWVVVSLFAGFCVLFLLQRLPDEVRDVEDDVVGRRLVSACRGTPAEDASRRLTGVTSNLPRFARANLVLMLLFSQAIQVLLLSGGLFVFFVVFGSLTIPDSTVEQWTGEAVTSLPSAIGRRMPVSNDLFQVAVFLAAFSGLYFTVSAVNDDTYRRQFFAGISTQLERAIAVHAVYQTLVAEESTDEE